MRRVKAKLLVQKTKLLFENKNCSYIFITNRVKKRKQYVESKVYWENLMPFEFEVYCIIWCSYLLELTLVVSEAKASRITSTFFSSSYNQPRAWTVHSKLVEHNFFFLCIWLRLKPKITSKINLLSIKRQKFAVVIDAFHTNRHKFFSFSGFVSHLASLYSVVHASRTKEKKGLKYCKRFSIRVKLIDGGFSFLGCDNL